MVFPVHIYFFILVKCTENLEHTKPRSFCKADFIDLGHMQSYETVCRQRKNFLTHQIGISVAFTHVRYFYLSHTPVPALGKDRKRLFWIQVNRYFGK